MVVQNLLCLFHTLLQRLNITVLLIQLTNFIFVIGSYFAIVFIFLQLLFAESGGIHIGKLCMKLSVDTGQFKRIVIYIFTILTTDKVPAVHIIHISITVIIFLVVGNFILIHPHDALEIFMVGVHAPVNDGHDHFFLGRLILQDGVVGQLTAYASKLCVPFIKMVPALGRLQHRRKIYRFGYLLP